MRLLHWECVRRVINETGVSCGTVNRLKQALQGKDGKPLQELLDP